MHSGSQSLSDELMYTWKFGKSASVLMIQALAACVLSLRLCRFAVAVHRFYIKFPRSTKGLLHNCQLSNCSVVICCAGLLAGLWGNRYEGILSGQLFVVSEMTMVEI